MKTLGLMLGKSDRDNFGHEQMYPTIYLLVLALTYDYSACFKVLNSRTHTRTESCFCALFLGQHVIDRSINIATFRCIFFIVTCFKM